MPILSSALVCIAVAIPSGNTLLARCHQDLDLLRMEVRIPGIDLSEANHAQSERARRRLTDLCLGQRITLTPVRQDRHITWGHVTCQGQDAARYAGNP